MLPELQDIKKRVEAAKVAKELRKNVAEKFKSKQGKKK